MEDHKKRNNRPKTADNRLKAANNRPKAADNRPKAAAGRAKPVDRRESICPVFKQCGACQMLSMPYEQQLEAKQKTVEDLLKKYCTVRPITGMKEPYHYRNKVHAVFGHQKGAVISGVYKANSHDIVPVERCMIEDEKADEIIGTIRGMLKSFKIRTYDEDSGYGLLRHVLVKRGFTTGEIMVVLVMASPIFPSRNNFIQVLREKHPEITTIIQNVNDRNTSMVLGDKEKTLYGKGYIEDVLSGCTFRISSKSFYQINPVQTEFLYDKAISLAALTGKETVIDAYCGIGTIGIIAGNKAGKVIGVELNKDAIRDAVQNAKCNQIANIQFYNHDAGAFMTGMASQGEKVDVVFMDPPRSGSTKEFIDSVAVLHPDRVIYISCNPVTLERDLQYFKKKGYGAKEAWPFDLFPQTGHCEVVCLLRRIER
ncbi:MAG: 23S rRNA (uracil(1939)-C(5))-methyltransferase RlmD [Hungatella sp.]